MSLTTDPVPAGTRRRARSTDHRPRESSGSTADREQLHAALLSLMSTLVIAMVLYTALVDVDATIEKVILATMVSMVLGVGAAASTKPRSAASVGFVGELATASTSSPRSRVSMVLRSGDPQDDARPLIRAGLRGTRFQRTLHRAQPARAQTGDMSETSPHLLPGVSIVLP